MNTSSLKFLWPFKNKSELVDHIQNHLEVFGYCTIEYATCFLLDLSPEDLINIETHKIENGMLSFVIMPLNDNFRNGDYLATLSAAQLKQSLKDAKKNSIRKHKARN